VRILMAETGLDQEAARAALEAAGFDLRVVLKNKPQMNADEHR